MNKFQHFLPTKIAFGNGILSEMMNSLLEYGKTVLVFTGERSAQHSGLLVKLKQFLKNHRKEVHVYSGITTNPLGECIGKCVEENRGRNIDCLIAIGGGSVHDFAKAVAIGLTHKAPLRDYTVTGKLGVPGINDSVLPVLCISTIGGTGAEISPASLVRFSNKKEIIFSPYLFPKLAIVDPTLMLSAPGDVAVKVGFDAFVQGLEAYTSKTTNPFSDLYALSAVKLSIKYLPRLRDREDLEAQYFIALAAIQGLFAVAQAGVGAIHALSDPLSGHLNIHHGQALALLIRDVTKLNFISKVDKFKTIATLFQPGIDEARSEEAIADGLCDSIESLIRSLSLDSYPIGNHDIDRNMIEVFVEDSRNPDITTNPRDLTDSEIRRVFYDVFGLK